MYHAVVFALGSQLRSESLHGSVRMGLSVLQLFVSLGCKPMFWEAHLSGVGLKSLGHLMWVPSPYLREKLCFCAIIPNCEMPCPR